MFYHFVKILMCYCFIVTGGTTHFQMVEFVFMYLMYIVVHLQ